MFKTYRNCDINITRDKPIIGDDKILFYSAFDNIDGYEVTSGFSEGEDSIREWFKILKETIDKYRLNPNKFKEE